MGRRVAGLFLAALIALSAQCVVLCSVGLHCAPAPDRPVHSHCHHHPSQGGGSACAHQQPFAANGGASPLPSLATSALAPAPSVPALAGVTYAALAGLPDTGPPALANPVFLTVLRV